MILIAIKAATGALAFVVAQRLHAAHKEIQPTCDPLKHGYIALIVIGVLQFSDAAVRIMV